MNRLSQGQRVHSTRSVPGPHYAGTVVGIANGTVPDKHECYGCCCVKKVEYAVVKWDGLPFQSWEIESDLLPVLDV